MFEFTEILQRRGGGEGVQSTNRATEVNYERATFTLSSLITTKAVLGIAVWYQIKQTRV